MCDKGRPNETKTDNSTQGNYKQTQFMVVNS